MTVFETKGGEFYTLEGSPYKGLYYVERKTNTAYTYSDITKDRKVLVPNYVFNTENYRLKGQIKGGYASPTPYKPTLTSYDYGIGFIDRYFIQKRTLAEKTVMEINLEQFNNISTNPSNNNISSYIYNAIGISWYISGNIEYVINYNKKQVIDAEKTFKGILNYIQDYTEFHK